MRDVWVAFLDHSSPSSRITNLKNQMSHNHSMMYESVKDVRDLKMKFGDRLEAWKESARSNVHRHVDLLPSSGKDVLRAANSRMQGETLVGLGQTKAGRTALSEAAILGGPVEHLAYARFLGRFGEFDEAYLSTQRAIDYFIRETSQMYSPLAAEAFAAQADILRRQGQDLDAIGRLEQALALLNDRDPGVHKVRCRILDNLGLAHQKLGDLCSARQVFDSALKSRRSFANDLEVCQSLVNLARLEVTAGNLDTSASYAEEVIGTLRMTAPTALHSNVGVLVAQVRLRQGRPREGVPHAKRALAVNRQIASRRGEAIALLLLAQCYRASGENHEAKEYALACLEVNRSMENQEGMLKAQWVLDQLMD